ncbi:Gastricsin precursor, putative [Perkinsus marinus ATCC 50983]|uniref:Gastricsin, putative n=1 Tax=Perkinsus marinus (strain ATCC 50983 / TXsc) TaxID=423536 RepID=C5K661_PERM5|nr:Gastricsin precursor, putative [Perkinsus marinus ATCC 50983]EER20091.1 Gastricsin precursor, putative [Perkinsus marinus ATCC 50983]|eukprot:XP_002788295.1 Gastricsin precursor, putative [Perkinsus marinus ATCC 50983]
MLTYPLIIWTALQGVMGVTLELPIFRMFMHNGDNNLYQPIQADGQPQNPIVDTGAPYVFFVWKDWYEQQTGTGACTTLTAQCYSCIRSCSPQHTQTINFGGGVDVTIFQNAGKLSLGTTSYEGMTFGLVCGRSPPPPHAEPHASFGLAKISDPGYPSIMDQLLKRRVIAQKVFALYLHPDQSGTSGFDGSLLLGGGSSRVYKGPLRFVPTVSSNDWNVMLSSVQVGSGHTTIGIKQHLLLDTGSNNMYVPRLYFSSLLRDISQQASQAAKAKVKIAYQPGYGVWAINCAYREFMPSITFGLQALQGDVLITIDSLSYVPMRSGICFLQIRVNADDADDMWVLPDYTLVGNYLEFQAAQNRIGIAKLLPEQ